jgi:SAM-dependent methyltransferase
MYQVLEHIWDPVRFLEEVYRKLKPGGMLFIEVPTLRNPLVSLYDIPEFKDFWFQKPHLYYFKEETLARVIREAGFQIVEMFPVMEVSFLNHVNWILRKKPMVSRKDCMDSKLPIDDAAVAERELLHEINVLFSQFDRQYMKKLEDAKYGDLIFCACRVGDGQPLGGS